MLQTPVLEAGSRPAYGNEAEAACREELAAEVPAIRSLATKCSAGGKMFRERLCWRFRELAYGSRLTASPFSLI